MTFRILLLSVSRRTKRIFAEVAAHVSAELVIPPDFTAAEFPILRERFDLIFADVEFPGLSRQPLLQAIRASTLNHQTPLYLMTGFKGPDAYAGREREFTLLPKPAAASEIEPLVVRFRQKLFAERRRTGRLPFQTEVHLQQGAKRFRGTSRNLSAQGLLLAADLPLERGSELEVRFLIEPGAPIFHARVRVVRAGDSPLFGVSFVSLDPFHRQRLQEFLERHLPTRSAGR